MAELGISAEELDGIVSTLIDPEKGDEWDRKQTPLSLSENIIEESCELVDAIRKGNVENVREELGDVFFLLLLTARKYEGKFSAADALKDAAEKMRRRHPHIFGDAETSGMEALNAQWNAIKKAEKSASGEEDGVFSSLPDSLPSMSKAHAVNVKAAAAGFTWEEDEEVDRQVEAEWLEFLDAKESGDEAAMEHELGDMLFLLAEEGRRTGIPASQATDMACSRFLTRFKAMEKMCKEQGRDISSLTLDEKDELWEQTRS